MGGAKGALAPRGAAQSVPEVGSLPSTIPEQRRDRVTVTGSACDPAVPMETLLPSNHTGLLLMSGGQLLFPWVFGQGAGARPGVVVGIGGQSEVGGCMGVLVGV